MFKNYLRLAFRNLVKQKGYTAINLLGMSVGMACCFLMLAFVYHERHYDEFFPDADQLYRLNYKVKFSEEPTIISRIPAPIAPELPDYFSEIESAARFFPRSISVKEVESDKQFEIDQALFADSIAIELLGLEMVRGNRNTALDNPFSLVVTESCAKRIFGDRDPMGAQLNLANQNTFTVTGVLKDLPSQSHIAFDFLAPFRNIPDVEREPDRQNVKFAMTANWLASYAFTYVRLHPQTDIAALDEKFAGFFQEKGHEDFRDKQTMYLENVQAIHVHTEAGGTGTRTANPVYLRLFSIVGILILLIACINFINLSTAIYLGRMKEIGVRKVLGAGRRSLIMQFMGETFLVSFIAFLLAGLLFLVLLPMLNAIMDLEIPFSILKEKPLAATFLGTFLVSGVLAGLYPAFFASRFKAVDIFQDRSANGKTGRGTWLRKSLITVQFAVGIALTIATLIIQQQLTHWNTMPLGFNNDGIITVPISGQNINSAFSAPDATLRARMNAFEDELQQHDDIIASTLGSALPGRNAIRHPVMTDKIARNDNLTLQVFSVDYDFSETFDLQLLAGRDFDKDFGTDHLTAFMINESAIASLGWKNAEDALGKAVSVAWKKGHVIGVIKDFHTSTLQNELQPFLMNVTPSQFTEFAIRLKTNDLTSTISKIENLWAEFFPEKAFEYTWHDENLASQYESEKRLAKLVGNFSAVAIFLACFGLFGIISFTVRQRSKEIGIRKVLGASVVGIVGLLSSDFMKLVGIAILIASPLAYYFAEEWLSEFAYRIDIPLWVFGTVGALAVGIAFLTVSVQAIRAALVHPVESLRDD